MRWMREQRDEEKFRKNMSATMKVLMAEWKETGQLDKARRKGKVAKGMLDHRAAKAWVVRDPYGRVYAFSNLSEWARRNECLFKDTRPDSTTPFWLRIAGGISTLLKKDGRSTSYKGWTVVSQLELDEGGRDLLGRDYFTQEEQENKETGNTT
jgi:hypothetical protein